MEISWQLYCTLLLNLYLLTKASTISKNLFENLNNKPNKFDSVFLKTNDFVNAICGKGLELKFQPNSSTKYKPIEPLINKTVSIKDTAGIYTCHKRNLEYMMVIIHVFSDVAVTETIVKTKKNEETLHADAKRFNYNKKSLDKGSVSIQCTCTVADISNVKNVKITWSGGLYPNDDFYSEDQKVSGTTVTSELKLKSVDSKHEKLFGKYECLCNLGSDKDSKKGSIKCPAILPSFGTSINVKEGVSKTLSCLPIVYFNDQDLLIKWEFNGKPLKVDSSDNMLFVNKSKFGVNINHAELNIKKVEKEHRGPYTCRVISNIDSKLFNDTTMFFLRVKDPLAVVWPFIGICVEVIILVAIILIYERKRLQDKANSKITEVDAGADIGPSETDAATKMPLQSIPEQPEPVKAKAKEAVDLRKRVI